MYFAVHMVTGSGDNYTRLVKADTHEQLVEAVRDTPDFEFIFDVYVDGEGLTWEESLVYANSILDAVYEAANVR